MNDTASPNHPHGPPDPRWIDDEGRCLLCAYTYHTEEIARLTGNLEDMRLVLMRYMELPMRDTVAAMAIKNDAREVILESLRDADGNQEEHAPSTTPSSECPQCAESLVYPRGDTPYCEECGWPDECREPDPDLIEEHDGEITFIHSPECQGFCDYACNPLGEKQAKLLIKSRQNTNSPTADTPKTDAAKLYVGTSRKQYVDAGFAEALERERDEAREAYKAETLSTAELMADNSRLERIVKDLNDANRVLFESQREAAETADEKPDGQAENASVMARPDGGPNQ